MHAVSAHTQHRSSKRAPFHVVPACSGGCGERTHVHSECREEAKTNIRMPRGIQNLNGGEGKCANPPVASKTVRPSPVGTYSGKTAAAAVGQAQVKRQTAKTPMLVTVPSSVTVCLYSMALPITVCLYSMALPIVIVCLGSLTLNPVGQLQDRWRDLAAGGTVQQWRQLHTDACAGITERCMCVKTSVIGGDEEEETCRR